MSILQLPLHPGRQHPEKQVHNIWLTPQIPSPTIIAILINILHVFLLIPIKESGFESRYVWGYSYTDCIWLSSGLWLLPMKIMKLP